MSLKCPKCVKSPTLRVNRPAGLPKSFCCSSCGGQFLAANEYVTWQQRLDSLLPENADAGGEFDFDDSVRAMICPGCGGIMVKYRVKNDLPFQLDFCRRCNGVWLDKNEWNALFARNLHDQISFMFTEGWQSKLNRERLEKRLDALFRHRIGEEAYAKVADFKSWLRQQPHQTEITAWLNETSSGRD